MAWGIVYLIYAIYVGLIGGGPAEAGFANGLFAFFAGITSLVAGTDEDRTARKEWYLLMFSFLTGAMFLVYPFITDIHQFYLVMVVQGISSGFFWPAFEALYSLSAPKKSLAQAWGMYDSFYYFSTMLGSFFVGVLSLLVGIKQMFFFVSMLFFFTFGVLAFYLNKNRVRTRF
jgi:MFS family permease